jgi:ABC-type nickel/cobalt efflux system permease component RcnA
MMSEDYIKEVLYSQQLNPLIIVLVMGISFILGAIHAMGPGHGKSLMAAYLVGSRSRLRDVFLLAASITLSHVISVIAIGVIALLLMDFFWSEKANMWLSLISGIFIITIGIWLLFRRLNVWRKTKAVQGKTDPEEKGNFSGGFKVAGIVHNHGALSSDLRHSSTHIHSHHHNNEHVHNSNHHHHHYDTNTSVWSNIWLGISAGLVPCPKALVILLLAISLQKTILGIIIIIVFSLGLASALVILGYILVKASHLLEGKFEDHRIQFLPVLGSAIIVGLGLFLTIRTWQLF